MAGILETRYHMPEGKVTARDQAELDEPIGEALFPSLLALFHTLSCKSDFCKCHSILVTNHPQQQEQSPPSWT